MKSMTLNPFNVLNAPDFVQPVALSSGVGQAFDTPAGAKYVAFGMNGDFWVKWGSTAAVAPSTSSTGSSGSEINPTLRSIGSSAGTTGFSLYSETAVKGHLAYFL